ncbi:MAG: alpha/beta fold hydrolase [Candidatus Hodarchaeales archaeon]
MKLLRKHGKPPYSIAVIHGGPGAGGEMAPVAIELSTRWGVLEPIQTASSIDGQIRELKKILDETGDLPITLVGFSWGAWLVMLFTAKHPEYTKKLIIISSGSFEEKYTRKMQELRLERLNEDEKKEYLSIIREFNYSQTKDKDSLLARLGELATITDNFKPIRNDKNSNPYPFRGDIFHSISVEAAELRRSGKLMEIVERIKCPVVAIHGDYDPHLAEGVEIPLSRVLEDFNFFLLEECGHEPWKEQHARERFFEILKNELSR